MDFNLLGMGLLKAGKVLFREALPRPGHSPDDALAPWSGDPHDWWREEEGTARVQYEGAQAAHVCAGAYALRAPAPKL